jgi:hypothetical protein
MRVYFKRLYILCGLLVLVAIGSGTVGPAGTAGADISGTVAQSYNAGPAVLPGMVVELKPHDPTTVIPLTAAGLPHMVGVVVSANDATLVLTPQAASAQQVLVSASGHYSLLVSNQNGPVKNGDYVTVSALPGIVMKAGSDQAEAIGRAGGSFNGNDSLGTMSLKGTDGRAVAVAIGQIPVDVQLSANPLFQKNTNGLSGFVTKAANSLAGRPISPNRAYLSTAVVLAALLITGIMFYTGTRSGIIAIGRNPLAQRAINRGLLQTVMVGLGIFVAGIIAAYLILRA